MKQAILILAFPLIILSAGCEGRQPPGQSGPVYYRGRDLAGREITLPRAPARIISLAPSNTEIVFALGAGDRLKGVTSACDFPPAAARIERLGDLGRISLERIVALAPDLVLAGNKTDAEALVMLESLGIPAAVTEATTFEETYGSIIEIGRMTGTEDEAKILTERMRTDVSGLAARVKNAFRPLCYYVVGFGDSGNWTAGPGSFINEMITLGGGRNAAAGLGKPWALVQIESVIAMNPDIVLVGQHTGPPEALKYEPGYRDLPAINKGRLFIINDDLVNRPGPRLPQGLLEIARALHPEIFGAEAQ
jgi:iron complex transport system substrate-binding protein